jgi:hypothetical protein
MKNCGIQNCTCDVMSTNRNDEGGKLCPAHFYALREIEQFAESLNLPEGPRRRYFINAVRIIAQVQRSEILSWRIRNPK